MVAALMGVAKEPQALTVTWSALMETIVTTARENLASTVESRRGVTG